MNHRNAHIECHGLYGGDAVNLLSFRSSQRIDKPPDVVFNARAVFIQGSRFKCLVPIKQSELCIFLYWGYGYAPNCSKLLVKLVVPQGYQADIGRTLGDCVPKQIERASTLI